MEVNGPNKNDRRESAAASAPDFHRRQDARRQADEIQRLHRNRKPGFKRGIGQQRPARTAECARLVGPLDRRAEHGDREGIRRAGIDGKRQVA